MGNNPQSSNAVILDRLLEAINFYRGIVLDSVEQELGDSPQWKVLRTRLLRAFGDRGLENRIRQIMDGNGVAYEST